MSDEEVWLWTTGRTKDGEYHVLHVMSVGEGTPEDKEKAEAMLRRTAEILGWTELQFRYKEGPPRFEHGGLFVKKHRDVQRFQKGGIVQGGGMFTRRHYVAIAEVLELVKGDDCRKDAAYALSEMFSADNPKFDRDRFLRASGVK